MLSEALARNPTGKKAFRDHLLTLNIALIITKFKQIYQETDYPTSKGTQLSQFHLNFIFIQFSLYSEVNNPKALHSLNLMDCSNLSVTESHPLQMITGNFID